VTVGLARDATPDGPLSEEELLRGHCGEDVDEPGVCANCGEPTGGAALYCPDCRAPVEGQVSLDEVLE
jgi:predicted amidophosphoribosyltransferase